MTQGIFRKLFPSKFHEYLTKKKYFFQKTGHDSEAFPETFSNILKSPESFHESLPLWIKTNYFKSRIETMTWKFGSHKVDRQVSFIHWDKSLIIRLTVKYYKVAFQTKITLFFCVSVVVDTALCHKQLTKHLKLEINRSRNDCFWIKYDTISFYSYI